EFLEIAGGVRSLREARVAVVATMQGAIDPGEQVRKAGDLAYARQLAHSLLEVRNPRDGVWIAWRDTRDHDLNRVDSGEVLIDESRRSRERARVAERANKVGFDTRPCNARERENQDHADADRRRPSVLTHPSRDARKPALHGPRLETVDDPRREIRQRREQEWRQHDREAITDHDAERGKEAEVADGRDGQREQRHEANGRSQPRVEARDAHAAIRLLE